MGIAEVKDSTMAKWRDGYVQRTWWEEESATQAEAAAQWRS